ncbi:MAG: hypothetical protein ACE5GQ_09600 [Nitrospinales bacterium]
MSAIKFLLAMLFVLFLSSISFAQTNSVETGIAPDVATGAQIAASPAGNDDPVNFRRGKGKNGDGGNDRGRGGRPNGCEDDIVDDVCD